MTKPVDLRLAAKSLSVNTALFINRFSDISNEKTKIERGKGLLKSFRTREPRLTNIPREIAAVRVNRNCLGEDTGSYVQLGRIIAVTNVAPSGITRISQSDFEAMGEHYQF